LATVARKPRLRREVGSFWSLRGLPFRTDRSTLEISDVLTKKESLHEPAAVQMATILTSAIERRYRSQEIDTSKPHNTPTGVFGTSVNAIVSLSKRL